MLTKTPRGALAPLLAVLLALGAILLGALFLIAPVWQPGHRTDPAPFQPPEDAVPSNEDAVPSNEDAVSPAEADDAAGGLINVNTATAEELTALPGIGSARAAAIVAWREEHGAFHTLAELAQLDGISARMVESWQGLAEAGTQQP